MKKFNVVIILILLLSLVSFVSAETHIDELFIRTDEIRTDTASHLNLNSNVSITSWLNMTNGTIYNTGRIEFNDDVINIGDTATGISLDRDSVVIGNNILVEKGTIFNFGYNNHAYDTGIGIGNNNIIGEGSVIIGHSAESYSGNNHNVMIGEILATSSYTDNSIAIGKNLRVYTPYNIMIGQDLNATGEGSVTIGRDIFNDAVYSFGWGRYASINANYTLTMGYDAINNGSSGIALGTNSQTLGKYGVSIGYGSSNTEDYTFNVGGDNRFNDGKGIHYAVFDVYQFNVTGNSFVAGNLTTDGLLFTDNQIDIGVDNEVSGYRGIGIGDGITSTGDGAIAIGRGTTALQDHAIAIGSGQASQLGSIAIGGTALSSGGHSVALGYVSEATSTDSIAIGYNSSATSTSAIAIGKNSVASAINSVALGSGTTNAVANTLKVGGDLQYMTLEGVRLSSDSSINSEFRIKLSPTTGTGANNHIKLDQFEDTTYLELYDNSDKEEFRIGYNGTNGNLKIVASNSLTPDHFSMDMDGKITMSEKVTIDDDLNVTGIINLGANTSSLVCDASNAGAIYYNGDLFKHYGCNSTNWNALY